MQGDTQSEQGVSAGSAVGTGHSGWLRRTWASSRGRWLLVMVTGLVLVVVLVVVAVVMFGSLSGESQSYRDGYSVGGSVFTADSSGVSPRQACTAAALQGPKQGGKPAGDSSSQWIQGCVDSFENAQSDN